MSEKKPPTVKCPSCGTEIVWSTDNPHRPFCSGRCRDQDFIAWANGQRSIAGNQEYDDLLSGDLPKE
jgi:endogenous inhibitor of DNA gyrase (YacG/DUF329 family)